MQSFSSETKEYEDVEVFLNGFDYYEEEQERESESEFEGLIEHSVSITNDSLSALGTICISELLYSLTYLYHDSALLSSESMGVDEDLSVWISHW